MIKSKFTSSNTLLNSTEYAIPRKDHLSFLALTSCQDPAKVPYPDPPSLAKYQCAFQLRGPGEGCLFLSLSYFSLGETNVFDGTWYCSPCSARIPDLYCPSGNKREQYPAYLMSLGTWPPWLDRGLVLKTIPRFFGTRATRVHFPFPLPHSNLLSVFGKSVKIRNPESTPYHRDVSNCCFVRLVKMYIVTLCCEIIIIINVITLIVIFTHVALQVFLNLHICRQVSANHHVKSTNKQRCGTQQSCAIHQSTSGKRKIAVC